MINTWLRLAVDDCRGQRRGETRSDLQRYKNGRVVGYSTHNRGTCGNTQAGAGDAAAPATGGSDEIGV